MTDYAGTYFTCAAVPGWASRGTDGNGVRWRHASEITGWDEPPDARNTFTPRAAAHGSFDAPVYDDVRTISWMGALVAPSRSAREACKLQLGQLARALKLGADLVGVDEAGAKTVHAKRSPGWKIASFGPLGLQYQAQVVCPDPYKYGPAVTQTIGLPSAGSSGLTYPLFQGTGKLEYGTAGNSGQVTLANVGTENAWPIFQVAGPVLGGLTLTDVVSGRQIVYAGDVPSSSVLLIIDSGAGRASLNGSDRSGLLTVKQWWPVPPAGTSTVQFATLGVSGQTGTLSATVAPTYQ